MREIIRAKLEDLKGVRTNLHENDFLLTWEQSEADLRAVLLTTEVLEQFVSQGQVRNFIGGDLSLGAEYRPYHNNNVLLIAGISGLGWASRAGPTWG